MRHILRVNVHQKGYTLFSVQGNEYQECPLDIISAGISQNYLHVQKRLDDMLNAQAPRWHFAVANLSTSEQPVVGYGCPFAIPDDKGRIGLSFVHAIEVKPAEINKTVVCMIQFLLPSMTEKLTKNLTGLAQGTISAQEFISSLTRPLDALSERIASLATKESNPLKEIQHDCGGATAVAWLSMAGSHAGISSPWEIYETCSRTTGMVSTVSSYAGASEIYPLSSYLYQLNHDHELLESLSIVRTRRKKSNLAGTSAVRSFSSENIHSAFAQENLVPQGRCSHQGVIYPSQSSAHLTAPDSLPYDRTSPHDTLQKPSGGKMMLWLLGIILLVVIWGLRSQQKEQTEKWQALENWKSITQKEQMEKWQALENWKVKIQKIQTATSQEWEAWKAKIQKKQEETWQELETWKAKIHLRQFIPQEVILAKEQAAKPPANEQPRSNPANAIPAPANEQNNPTHAAPIKD